MKAKSFLVAAALVAGGCTPDFLKQDEALVLLQITKITGTRGGPTSGTEADFLISDVATNNGSVFNDDATLTFQSISKDPNRTLVSPGFNDIVLEQYEVVYTRSDGRDTEGVDVPFRFTGAMATLVPAGATAAASIIVVRHQAKREPPLRNIQAGGGPRILSVTATITVHGRTTSGKAVTASGRLAISFADFVDE